MKRKFCEAIIKSRKSAAVALAAVMTVGSIPAYGSDTTLVKDMPSNWAKEAVEKDGISELMKLYVKFHEEADKNPELVDEARAWFNKMENGDAEALSIWQWFKDISLVEYKRTYNLLGMDFDYYLGERQVPGCCGQG